MSDLIRRQAVYEMLHNLGGCDATNEWESAWDEAIDTAVKELEDIPTAYDVDKVVESLMNNTHVDDEKCYFIPEEAIRIVKAGGAMTNEQAKEWLESILYEDFAPYTQKALLVAIQALEKQKIIENLHITLEEVIARNLIAWETSRDKREGYLPEVYLTNQILFKQFTGLEPTIPNLKEVGRLD